MNVFKWCSIGSKNTIPSIIKIVGEVWESENVTICQAVSIAAESEFDASAEKDSWTSIFNASNASTAC